MQNITLNFLFLYSLFPSSVSVFHFLIHIVCFMSFGFTLCLHPHLTDGFDSTPFRCVCNSFYLIFTLHPVHVFLFCVSSLALGSAPSVPAPLCSIGTREGVTQKNLSGLLPIRDFRLDPSLLYSLPLLALSPNLLIVWVFLSIAYLLAKLRCSWAWNPLFPFFFLSFPRSGYLSTFFLCFSVSSSSGWGAVCRQC